MTTNSVGVEQTGFRFQGKKLLLTYKGHLDKPGLHIFIDRKLKCECQVKICWETGATGYKHTHCAILIPKKPDIRDCRFFDFEHEGEVVHPNIRIPSTVYHWKNIVNYIDKQDDNIYGEIEVKKSQEEKLKNAIEWVNSCDTWARVFHCPDMEIMNTISGKLQFFQNMHKFRAQHRVEKAKYTLDQFNRPALDLAKPVLLCGGKGCGKTQFALAHFNKPLYVQEKDDFAKFVEGYHDGIVIDEMSFTHWPNGSIINMLQLETTISVHCRYGDAKIPAGTPRIFCYNNDGIFSTVVNPDAEQSGAIERRYIRIWVDGPLFNRAL